MTIQKNETASELTLAPNGRVDTNTAPLLEAELKASIEGKSVLILDFEKVEFISSGGLRVLLMAQKMMNKQGKMTIKNVCEDVMEVFEMTGFNDIMDTQAK